ncbi:MAG: hypothetical protein WB586_11820 [Chthoniobacterales bacterium]
MRPFFTMTDEAALAHALIKAYKMGFVQFHVVPHNVANHLGERPAVSELARFQLQQDTCATSQLHTSVDFPDPFQRHLVLLLDGTRDRQMLAREMMTFVKSGRGTVYKKGTRVEDPDELETIVEQRLREDLECLMREGMLVP